MRCTTVFCEQQAAAAVHAHEKLVHVGSKWQIELFYKCVSGMDSRACNGANLCAGLFIVQCTAVGHADADW